MKTIYITLILSFLFLNNCKDEPDSNERGQNILNFYLLSQPPFLRPNYCGQPQLMLEEGVTYNIKLEPGKRYWFDYVVGSESVTANKKIRLTVNVIPETNLSLGSNDCSFPIDESRPFVIPKSSTSNQVIYELGIWNGTVLSSLILNSGDPNITLSFEIF